MMKKDVYIVNPKSASGKGKRIWMNVERYLLSNNITYSIYFTSRSGEATEIVKEIVDKMADGIKSIIIIGGDGTVQEAISGLPNKEVPFSVGVIAGGTGNDFVRSIGQDKHPLKALKRIQTAASEMKVDIGYYEIPKNKANGKFVNALGAGFDAEVGQKANNSKIKSWLNKFGLGSLSYVLALISLIITYKRTNLTINVDGKKHAFSNVWFVTIANGPFYGGGMKISPNSSNEDGILDVIIVHNLSRLKLLALFGLVFVGKHIQMKEVATFNGKEIYLESEDKILVHADGETVGYTPVNISVLQTPLKILV
jgi:diacylglycerol kinase (ATP)